MDNSLHAKLTDLSPAQRALDAWALPSGEPIVGKTYIADGWVYRDLPRLSLALFDEFLGYVGVENIVWLTLASYPDARRGQCLISPTGIANLAALAPANPTEKEA